MYNEYLSHFIKKLMGTAELLIFRWRVLPLLHHLYSSVYLIKGKEKHGRVDITILFYGDENSLSYINNILFSKKPKIEEVERCFIFNIEKNLSEFANEIDAVFIKTDRIFTGFLQKKKFFTIPEWVEMELDVSGSLDTIYKNFKKSAREDIKKIKKMGYSYEISTDPDKLELFYNNMHLPYISEKYEKENLSLASFYDVKMSFKKGKLLLIKDSDKYVSGLVFEIHNKTAYPVYPGVSMTDGGLDYHLLRGAGAAIYYYSIIWAKDNGIKSMVWGNCRSFPNNGIFRFKRKWGMHIKLSRILFGVFGFKFYNHSISIQEFLANNPFIYIEKDQLKGFISVKKDGQLNNKEVQHLLKTYYTPGLTELNISAPNGFTQDAKTYSSLSNDEKNFYTILTDMVKK